MKICYYANSKGFHEKKWAEYFINKGYEVSFISMDSSGNLSKSKKLDRSQNLDIFVKYIENPILRVLYRLLLSPIIAYRFYKRFKLIQPDIVHAHSVQYGFFAALSSTVPIVFTPMGSDVIIYAQKYFIYRLMAKFAFKRASVITGDSLLLQRSGFKVGARIKNNFIIQNGVDTKMFHTDVNKGDFRKRYNISEETNIILSTRLLTENYNIDKIIISFNLLLKFKPDSLLVLIYGYKDDRYYKYLDELLSKYIPSDKYLNIGFLEYSIISSCLIDSDVYISIPTSDSSPKSVYEAMACGIPSVVSNIPWTTNFINNEKEALIVNWKNEDDIANSILKLLDHKDLYNKISKSGSDFVKNNIDYYKNMLEMENIMLNIFS